MPEYSFKSSDGEIEAVFYHMDDAPKIGSTVRRKGKTWTRIPDDIQRQPREDIFFTSKSLPLNWPYAPRHNALGEPQFASKREVTESVARSKGEGDPVDYD